MDVELLEIPKQEAKEELKNLKVAIKKGYINERQKLTKDLLSVYQHLQHGGKIIDIFEVFPKFGLDKNGNPMMAISIASAKYCNLYKRRNGGAIFSRSRQNPWSIRARKKDGDIQLPADSFEWPDEENDRVRSLAPIIPARIYAKVKVRVLSNYYHIIFEPESWEKIPVVPSDPILGRMLTPNLFGVLATWDLTRLEKKILKGYAMK